MREELTREVIAERLGMAVKTVVRHREDLNRRLGVHNSVDLTKLAIQMGSIFGEQNLPGNLDAKPISGEAPAS